MNSYSNKALLLIRPKKSTLALFQPKMKTQPIPPDLKKVSILPRVPISLVVLPGV